jgi:dTDP-4-amino-4,6-dideoxygalactose transaminase
MKIPFNKPAVLGNELDNIKRVLESGKLSGDGEFTKKCQELMEARFKANRVMLTTSCTHALDLSAMLADIKPGDEVICPSYTFVSSANCFVLRGGIPKFVEIREDTLNIDENHVEEAITDRTKAIMAVHYAGVGCEMDAELHVRGRRCPCIKR